MTETDPQNRRLGYARVSTYGQTLDAQLDQLRADGCAKLYREKASGAQADRRELQRMLKAIRVGDLMMVTRIDRLARSTFDLFAICQAHHRRGRAIPIAGRAVGRHRHQHQPADAGLAGRIGQRSRSWRRATMSALPRFHGFDDCGTSTSSIAQSGGAP